MANFDGICEWTLRFEDATLSGKVSKLPGDTGGMTRFGIATNEHPEVDPSFYTTDAASALDIAKGIYRGFYWKQIWGDQIGDDQPASVLYDFAVNSGAKKAIKHLQALLGFDESSQDGVFGPITLAKLNEQDPSSFAATMRQDRYDFDKQTAADNPNDEKFLANWERRASAVYPDNAGL